MNHQIWVEYDNDGNIIQCWEAPDPVDPEYPDIPPISMEYIDENGIEHTRLNTIGRVSPPADLAALLKESAKAGRAISALILEGKKFDKKTKKLKDKEKV